MIGCSYVYGTFSRRKFVSQAGHLHQKSASTCNERPSSPCPFSQQSQPTSHYTSSHPTSPAPFVVLAQRASAIAALRAAVARRDALQVEEREDICAQSVDYGHQADAETDPELDLGFKEDLDDEITLGSRRLAVPCLLFRGDLISIDPAGGVSMEV